MGTNKKFKEWVAANGGVPRVARALGVCRWTVYRWFDGHSPSSTNIRKITRWTKGAITVDDLIGMDEKDDE